MYRLRGEPQEIPTPGKNLRVGVWGALRWPDGPFVFSAREGSVASGLFMSTMIKLRSRTQETQKKIVLVRDNGPEITSHASRAMAVQVKPWVKAFALPRYTSTKLNDLENVWKHLKEDYFSRMLVERPEDFTQATIELLDRMRPRPRVETQAPAHRSHPMGKKSGVPA